MGVKFKRNHGTKFHTTFSSGGGTMKVSLVVPTTATRMAISNAFLIKTRDAYEGMLKEIASELWVGFEGACDEEGNPIPDTPENRFDLLQSSDELTTFIISHLSEKEKQLNEGKEEGVSA